MSSAILAKIHGFYSLENAFSTDSIAFHERMNLGNSVFKAFFLSFRKLFDILYRIYNAFKMLLKTGTKLSNPPVLHLIPLDYIHLY